MSPFLDIVLSAPESSLLYEGFYDPLLVVLSVGVAIFASHAALLVAQRIALSRTTTARHLWTAVGGLCLGAGIWTMHFVGMLAFGLPCTVAYDPAITLLSMIPGILASTLAMTRISHAAISPLRLGVTGLLLGAGIGAMHFSGMAAMRLEGLIRYDLKLFLLSIGVAVALATLSLWTKFRLQSLTGHWSRWALPASAVVMGLAVSGMHYTAMAAAYFIQEGDPAIVDSQITQTFLAAGVLVITCGIIVVTLVATFLARPSFLPLASHFGIVGALVAVWCGVAWLSADYHGDRQEKNAYRQASQTVRHQADDIAARIEHEIKVLQGMATMLSKEDGILGVLRRFGPDATPSLLAQDERRRLWTPDPPLSNVNRFLVSAVTSLPADVVYLMNAAGDCVASSNAGASGSFVGGNFADRDYFRQPREGRPGRQYAMGRISKVPGLYYSHPVIDEGRFIGVVVVKRDISGFLPWFERTQAFAADAKGVIVLTEDKGLENRALPDASVLRLGREETASQYGRTDIQPLDMKRWSPKRPSDVIRIGNRPRPMVLASRGIPEGAITIHVPQPLPEWDRIDAERYWLFLLLSVAGGMLIAATTAIVMYLRTSRETKNTLRRQAMELARSNADLQQFAYATAHDLQEPLRAITIYMQMLHSRHLDKLDEEARSAIGHAVDAAKIIRAKIADIQVYLRLAERIGPFAPVNTDHILAGVLEGLKIEIAERNASVRTAPLPDVLADGAQLAQVFGHLIGNALKYQTPDLPPEVTISAEERDGECLFSVTDNGIGIAADYHERIFGVFKRLHTQQQYPGTGMGLAICKKIVECHGGRMGVRSEMGKGSTFFFSLPVRMRSGGIGDAGGVHPLRNG